LSIEQGRWSEHRTLAPAAPVRKSHRSDALSIVEPWEIAHRHDDAGGPGSKRKANSMQTRTHSHTNHLGLRASARRRIRRASAGRLYCATNGCTTYLVIDADRHEARCPVCGARRRLH
jgi:hypothetical protein